MVCKYLAWTARSFSPFLIPPKWLILLNTGKKEGMVWFNKHSEEFDNAAAIEKLKNSLDTCMSSFQKAKVLFPLQFNFEYDRIWELFR